MVGVVGSLSHLLFGFWGTFLVLFSIYLPIPILLSIFFLKQINPHFEEVARLMTGEFGVLKGIVLPLIKPALVLSFLLVFILSFGEIGVANVLRYEVFSQESFTQFSAFYDSKSAMVLAMPMVLVVALVILFEKLYVKNSSFRYKSFNTSYEINLTNKMHFYTLLSVSLLVFFIVFLPLFSLIWQMGDFKIAFEKAWEPLQRSLMYSFVGASLLMVFGFLYGYIIEKRLFFSNTLDMGILFLFALPSTVMGISLILFFNTSFTEFIYTTPLIVLFGYFSKYLALTTKIAQTKLSSIPTSMSEAAQMSGANWFQRLLYILLPLSKKTLFAMFLVGFIFTLRESSITQLVYPAGYETLPVYILTQMANGKTEIIASLCVILTLMMIVPLFTLLSVGNTHDRV
jgi:iron(III) transport system permease protein